MLLTALQWGLAIAMCFVGVMHFVSPEGFIKIVPAWLPAPRALVYVSGVFEILGGVGLVIPSSRRIAAWGLVALFVAVFPANINMAVKRIQLTEKPLPVWLMWARLPLQGVLIAWAWLFT